MSANWSEHRVLTTSATTWTAFTNSAVSHVQGTPRLRVVNRAGASEVYITVSVDPNTPAAEPAAPYDGAYVIPATIAEEFIPLGGLDRYLQVKLIAPDADTSVSVILDSAHWGPGAYRGSGAL